MARPNSATEELVKKGFTFEDASLMVCHNIIYIGHKLIKFGSVGRHSHFLTQMQYFDFALQAKYLEPTITDTPTKPCIMREDFLTDAVQVKFVMRNIVCW